MDQQLSYILNTWFLLSSGCLVMLMAAGFAMLEAGMVRSRSVSVILAKNISLYAVAGVVFYMIGHNLMFTDVSGNGGFFGTPGLYTMSPTEDQVSQGYADTAFWFFQMVFVATAASIVSGALAERIKLWPFMIFCCVLTGLIYPLTGSWTWGGGWLSTLGFKDFAGSTIVHSVGGWAALTGAILLGARRGRFTEIGKSKAPAPSSMPLVTLGTFILWFGWFGFNGGSQLAIASVDDAISVAHILANTNMAAAGGVIAIMMAAGFTRRKLDLPLLLNGALAGLVSITAEPVTPTLGYAILIGAVGALIMYGAVKALEKAKIDDVVGAVPVHLAAGIWGTLAVCLTNPEASLTTQLIGIGTIGATVTTLSLMTWGLMKATIGIRLHATHEDIGGDMAELGLRAYNIEHIPNDNAQAA